MTITATRRWLATACAAGSVLTVAPAATAGAAPYCGITWGSLQKQDLDHTTAHITNLRAGRHDCFDRLVVDLGPPAAGLPGPQDEGFTVRYVPQVLDDPSGAPVALAGGGVPGDRGQRSRADRRLRADVLAGQPRPGRRRRRVPHVPPGRLPRHARGADADRARGAGAPAVPGVRARRPRWWLTRGDRRRPPVVTAVSSTRRPDRGRGQPRSGPDRT